MWLFFIPLYLKRTVLSMHHGFFQSARKIKEYLVRAKLGPIQTNIGSRSCNKSVTKCVTTVKCQTALLAQWLGTWTTLITILNDSKFLICLSTCNKCKIKYSGQTCDQFRLLWNNYKSYARKPERNEDCKQKFSHPYYL